MTCNFWNNFLFMFQIWTLWLCHYLSTNFHQTIHKLEAFWHLPCQGLIQKANTHLALSIYQENSSKFAIFTVYLFIILSHTAFSMSYALAYRMVILFKYPFELSEFNFLDQKKQLRVQMASLAMISSFHFYLRHLAFANSHFTMFLLAHYFL